MNMLKKIALLTVAASLMASTAIAAPSGDGAKREPVSRAERLERAGERFDAADKNNDGLLNAEERRDVAKERRAKKGEKKKDRKADGEPRKGKGDGKGKKGERKFEPISRDSALEKAGERFDKADKNGDGVLSPEEMRAAKKARGEMRKEKRAARG